MNLQERFVEAIHEVTPKYKIVEKESSAFMRFLGALLFFNKRFMTSFTTTIGNTVYVPKARLAGTRILPTLAHEAQHVWDHNRWYGHIFYAVGYLMPQILAIGSLLALLAIWYSNLWLMFLLCLVFLVPMPAPFRMMIERRGYLMSLACTWWLYGKDDVDPEGWPVSSFSNSSYYFMWSFKGSLAKWFARELQKIKDGEYPTPVFEVVHKFLQSENLTK